MNFRYTYTKPGKSIQIIHHGTSIAAGIVSHYLDRGYHVQKIEFELNGKFVELIEL